MMYASIYVIPQRIFMWSVGLTYFTEAPDKKTLFQKSSHTSMHPVCIYRSFFLMVTQIQLPEVLNVTMKKYCRCKYISCNGTGGRDLIQGKNEGTGRS